MRTTNQSLSTEAKHQRRPSAVKRIMAYRSESTLPAECEEKKRAFDVIAQRIASSKVTVETEGERATDDALKAKQVSKGDEST